MRYIDFTIDGASTDILVHMEEQPDGTILVRLVSTGVRADIRGLFFDMNDASILSHLSVSGSQVTGFQAADERVMDLGRGVNMQGNDRGPFDVGIAFGTPGNGQNVVTSTSFVLSSSVGGLTLDDLALVDMGVRLTGGGVPPKMTMVTPAAPDAHDDTLTAVEDTTIVYHVLDNDTDSDGTADFRIVSVTDPVHGTATISADGKTIIYTPDHDYSGTDSFGYSMIDGHGGGDDAIGSIAVEAVADAPTLTVTTAAGANVNEILLTVSSAVTDVDGSEYLDRIEFSNLAAGAQIVGESDAVYDPSGTSPTLSRTFTLQLQPNTDFNFDLGITAIAKESSNGDEEGTTNTVNVAIDSHHNAFDVTFQADDQSMWDTGDAWNFVDDRFLGFEVDPPEASTGGFIYGSADLYLKAGFQSTLTLTSGEIDATVPYDINVDTTYNHVTDVMLISSSALLDSANVSFNTAGPGGSYALDFIFNWALSASLGIDFEIDSYNLFSFSEGSNNTINILDLDSHDLSLSYDFPYGISATLAWPQIDTTSDAGSGTTFTASGASNNFFELGLDIDQLLADILLDGANPFDIGIDIGVAGGNVELLDVDVSAGLNLAQNFLLSLSNLTGSLIFEDGSTQAWSWGDIVLNNASSKDANHDGTIDYTLDLHQASQMTNDLDLGVNVGWSVDLLKAAGWWDFGLDSGDWSAGPVYHAGDTYDVASIDLYKTTFGFNFEDQMLHFAGNETLV